MHLTINLNVRVLGIGDCPRHVLFLPRSLTPISAPKRTLKGLKVDYQLSDDTAVNFTLAGVDEWGNPTTTGLGTPTISSISDPTILSATVQPDNSITVSPLGKIGVSQIAVAVPVGNQTLNGQLNVTVVAGTAVSINFTPGTTTPVTNPNTPPVNSGGGGGTPPTP